MSRAVVVTEPGRHTLLTREVPRPGPGEVRVKVAAAGICLSDREVHDGRRAPGYVRYPVTPGHEWSGTVEAVGEGVDPGLLGRACVAEGFRSCGTCERCRQGATNLCTAGYAETGFTEPGAFADHVIAPARLLHVLRDGVDLRAAALIEPAAVVAAAIRVGVPRPTERVAVVGAGTLGVLAVQWLASYSPADLAVIDPRADRALFCRDHGATRILSPDEAAAAGGGFDLVVETAGAPPTAASSCLLARRGGRVVLTGMFNAGSAGIDPVHLAVSQLEIRSVFGASSTDWQAAVAAFQQGILGPAALITHEFPLERYAKAVALVGSGDPKVGKVLLVPGL